MASLKELREIEQQRVHDERAAVHAAEAARARAREAEARAKVEAEAAKQRAEFEAKLAIEDARASAEREARMKIEAAEAAERTRQAALLAEARLVQEMELRRAEVAKKRPTWMLVVTGIATLAAFVLVYVAIERTRRTEQAESDRQVAIAKQREMKAQVEDLTQTIKTLEADTTSLATRVDKAADELAVAEGAAKIAEARAKVEKLRAEQAELRRRQNEAKRKRDELIRKGGVHMDEKCLKEALC